jgi:hypothetical protein
LHPFCKWSIQGRRTCQPCSAAMAATFVTVFGHCIQLSIRPSNHLALFSPTVCHHCLRKQLDYDHDNILVIYMHVFFVGVSCIISGAVFWTRGRTHRPLLLFHASYIYASDMHMPQPICARHWLKMGHSLALFNKIDSFAKGGFLPP